VFFLLSGPEPGPKTWDLCTAAREAKVQLERVCGISSDPGCCTLGPGCSNLDSDQVELRGLEPLTPCLQTTGSTSTRVHSRRSPSLDVHADPSGSRLLLYFPAVLITLGLCGQTPRCHSAALPGEARQAHGGNRAGS
jgi:hypothetical protein